MNVSEPDPFESMSVPGLLTRNAEHRGDRVALVDEDHRVTHDELRVLVRTVAAAELADVEAGDRVAIWAANSVVATVLALAAAWRGAVAVPLNTRYKGSELEHCLSLTGCTFLYLEPQVFSNSLSDIAEQTVTIGGEVDRDRFPQLREVRTLPAISSWTADVAGGRSSAAPEDPAVIFFTSGSTGPPKAMVHSHRSLIRHAHFVAERQSLHDQDTLLLAVPLSGSFGYLTLFEGLAAGSAVALTSESKPARFASFVEAHSCTVLNITDAYMLPFLKTFNRSSTEGTDVRAAEESFRSVRAATGGVFEVEPYMFTAALDEMGVVFSHAYGMSEVHAMTYFDAPGESAAVRAVPGGPAVSPGTESRVVDGETGSLVTRGSLGVLEIRGPVTIDGYVTSEAGGSLRVHDPKDAEGWLSTGDLATIGPDGRMTFHGRLDHAMRLRGFLVTPAEIETHILSIDDVVVCKVVGVEGQRGAEAVALIEAEVGDGDELTQRVLDHCRSGLANYKVPAAVLLVEAIPRISGSTGTKMDITGAQEAATRWLHQSVTQEVVSVAHR